MLTETILLAQNKKLRERIDELEETVRQFGERERARAPAVSVPDWVPHLTRLEERSLLTLLGARGIVSKPDFYRSLYGDNDEADIKIVDVMVCHLRKKLGDRLKIKTFWGRGYAIERDGETFADIEARTAPGEISQLLSEELAA